MPWTPPAWATQAGPYASTSAAVPPAPTKSATPSTAPRTRTRITAEARSILDEFFRTVTDRPTAGQKHELLARVQTLCPDYSLSSLNNYFSAHRKAERDRTDPYEREVRKSLFPTLSDESIDTLNTILLKRFPAPTQELIDVWVSMLHAPACEISAYIAHWRALGAATSSTSSRPSASTSTSHASTSTSHATASTSHATSTPRIASTSRPTSHA
ncbi:hypothetical protein EVG20_g11474, partial [Dentipellis fragilis]